MSGAGKRKATTVDATSVQPRVRGRHSPVRTAPSTAPSRESYFAAALSRWCEASRRSSRQSGQLPRPRSAFRVGAAPSQPLFGGHVTCRTPRPAASSPLCHSPLKRGHQIVCGHVRVVRRLGVYLDLGIETETLVAGTLLNYVVRILVGEARPLNFCPRAQHYRKRDAE